VLPRQWNQLTDMGTSLPMSDLPRGTVTFLFTDIEGSTRLWEDGRSTMSEALERHDNILQQAISDSGGVIFSTGGDGLAAAFERAPDALRAALDAQARLQSQTWDPPLSVRMAIHTGDVESRAGDYFGPPLNRCARLMPSAHGGQVLCSSISASLASDQLPEGSSLRDLGSHRLRDLSDPEHIFQVWNANLRSDFPPLRSLDTYRGNLPVQPTVFIGRDAELTEIAKALDEARVVTLSGVGGVGKTRLALQVAAEVLPRFDDGAWLVELASLGTPESVVEVVASTLGVQASPGKTLEQSVSDHLERKSLLLILDNCEHLLNAAAKFVGTALRVASGLKVLTTSREGLALPGERLMTVPSLQIPDTQMSLDDLLATESVRLFTERARESDSRFTFHPNDAAALGELSRRLDGIPLAIELAAARIRVMTPKEMLEHLDRRFKLLSAGRRTAVSRHQTLRSTIDWSYDLLDEPERVVLRRLSVFSGDFDLPSAQGNVADDDLEPFDVSDILFRLVEKSLVVADPGSGTTRYRLLETIRDYAWERLSERGEDYNTSERHCQHFLALAEDLGQGLCGRDEPISREKIVRDLENFRTSLRRAIDADDAEVALRLVDALSIVGSLRSPYGSMPQRVAELSGAAGHPLTPVALASAAAALSDQGDNRKAAALVHSALDLAGSQKGTPAGDHAFCRVCGNVAMVAHIQSDMGRFLEMAKAWKKAAYEIGDAFEISQALNLLGSLRDDPEEAMQACEESLRLARELGGPSRIAYSSIVLASRLVLVDVDRAEPVFAEALEAGVVARNDWVDLFAATQLALLQARKVNGQAPPRCCLKWPNARIVRALISRPWVPWGIWRSC
jgi:predicted ATPase/class 3 adenylate cyclase